MKKNDENGLVVCEECNSSPCKWRSVGEELLPCIYEFIEEQGGQGSVKNTYEQVSTRDIMDDKNDVMVDKNQKGKQYVGFLYLESI